MFCINQPGTCSNSKPITAPNTPFSCPNASEFNPANGNLAPTETNCCKVAAVQSLTQRVSSCAQAVYAHPPGQQSVQLLLSAVKGLMLFRVDVGCMISNHVALLGSLLLRKQMCCCVTLCCSPRPVEIARQSPGRAHPLHAHLTLSIIPPVIPSAHQARLPAAGYVYPGVDGMPCVSCICCNWQ